MNSHSSYTSKHNADSRVAETAVTTSRSRTSYGNALRATITRRIENNIQHHKSHPRTLMTPNEINLKVHSLISSTSNR